MEEIKDNISKTETQRKWDNYEKLEEEISKLIEKDVERLR